MTQDKALVEKITDAGEKVTNVFSQFWEQIRSRPSTPADASRVVSVDQLPLYAEDGPTVQQKFVPEQPLPLQREFSTVRAAFNEEYDRVAQRFKVVERVGEKGKKAACRVNSYLTEEWTALPKAAAITVGGMAGFVLGLKRGLIGRTMTTAVGFATMAAFCYPVETVDVVRTGVAHSQSTWQNFQQSPHPPTKKDTNLSPPKN